MFLGWVGGRWKAFCFFFIFIYFVFIYFFDEEEGILFLRFFLIINNTKNMGVLPNLLVGGFSVGEWLPWIYRL